MAKSNYSVKGDYRVGDKIISQERIYPKASSFEEAVEMAKEDGNVGPGMVFFNLGESEKCNLWKLNLERLLAQIYLEKSKN